MSVSFWLIVVGFLAFLTFLLLDLVLGIVGVLNFVTQKANKAEETEPEDIPLTLSECIDQEAEVVEKLTPYGKIRIKNHTYDAMSISGDITCGTVKVYRKGTNRLLVTTSIKQT